MANQIGFEIDFLPVGNGDRSGDAIAIRYGSAGNYKVIVYDGGNKESGEMLVEHIRKYYGTNRVDYVVNSHPDGDHASGLSVVLEKMEVGELWMHQPWKYSSLILDYFRDGRITDASLAKRLKEKMAAAYALEQLAEYQEIPIYEPFLGKKIGEFYVLSPEMDWYIHDLIAEFKKSPDQKRASEMLSLSYAQQIMRAISESAQKEVTWIAETWGVETLRENVQTSSENESSVVLYGDIDGRGVLLTGDAGVRALTATADIAEANDISLASNLRFVQIPHHGSRNNVSTTVLDRIIGLRKSANDGEMTKTAFVSASKNSTTHPRKAVVNAFIRRGAKVVATQGSAKSYRHNIPNRENWSAAEPLSFSDKVEAWE